MTTMYEEEDLINEMIMSTGSRPLTPEQRHHPLLDKAKPILDRERHFVNSVGLWYNTRITTLTPDKNNRIQFFPNASSLRVISADPLDRRLNYAIRGNNLINADTGSSNLGSRDPIEIRLVYDDSLAAMPMIAQEYVRARAVYSFYLNENGTEPKLSNYRNAVEVGWQYLYRENLRHKQANVFDSPSSMVLKLRRGRGEGRWKPLVN